MEIHETELNLIAEGTKLEGSLAFNGTTRIQGYIRGEVTGLTESEIVLGEHGMIEGKLKGEQIWIDGTVMGDIQASTKITISRTGRVFGTISAPKLSIEFGAVFEGTSKTEPSPRSAPEPKDLKHVPA